MSITKYRLKETSLIRTKAGASSGPEAFHGSKSQPAIPPSTTHDTIRLTRNSLNTSYTLGFINILQSIKTSFRSSLCSLYNNTSSIRALRGIINSAFSTPITQELPCYAT
ncbi:hypothetical protein VTN00DRAFT_4170 [Thermoascus crustaceus]|uniref:uncharacterized protein n=1 Tax=Thermoascus crustaceus TaxID=5088 RepID=UPI0037422BF6